MAEQETDSDGVWTIIPQPSGAKVRVLYEPSADFLTKQAAIPAFAPIDRIKKLTDAMNAKGIDIGSI